MRIPVGTVTAASLGSRCPDPRVVRLVHELPIGDVSDLAAAFPGVPVSVIEGDTVDFYRSLRLVTTSTCAMRCGFPGESTMWCHNEGQARNGVPAADLRRVADLVDQFRQRYGITSVVLAGLQPKLDGDLLWFVGRVRELGIDDVAFTSHGLGLERWLEPLRDAGLTGLTLSVQSFARDGYREIMGIDALDNAMRVIELARELRLRVAVNRVLLRGHTDDVAAVIGYVRRQDLWVRLYDLMWQPGHDDQFLRYFVSWQELVEAWRGDTERMTVWRYTRSGRVNIAFDLASGGRIETNLPLPPAKADADVCATCEMAPACTEGYLGCGIRLTPDYRVQPCLLRPDLAVSAGDGLDSEEVDALLLGHPVAAGLYSGPERHG